MNTKPNENTKQQSPIETHLSEIDAKLVKIQEMQEKIFTLLTPKPEKPAGGFKSTEGIRVGQGVDQPFSTERLSASDLGL